MRIKLLLVTYFVLLGLCLFAQEENPLQVRLAGIVFDSETIAPLQDVNCINGTYLTTTDRYGRFSMNTTVGDTVRFSYIGYRGYELVIPDTLQGEEYIVAVALPADTLILPEVIVIHRYGEEERVYTINARNNMNSAVRGAFFPTNEMTLRQNQQRVLDEYAASTNKAHVDVKFGVGLESWRTYKKLSRDHRKRNEIPELLSIEEMDLVKALLQFQRQDNTAE